MQTNKILVTYFSASGQTKKLAQTISSVTQGDLFEIEPKEKYTSADLNWNDKKSRSSIEMEDQTSRPEILNKKENMNDYNIIFVGFPIWWYEAPRIIETFLESYDFSNKTIIPFATSGGSGMGKTDSILEACCTDAIFKKGKKLNAYASEKEVKNWIESLDL